MISYDPSILPFSRRGVFMTLSVMEENYRDVKGPAGLYLKHMSGFAACPTSDYAKSVISRLVPVKDGQEVEYSLEEKADSLTMKTEFGNIVMAFSKDGALVAEGTGVDLRLHMQENTSGFQTPFGEGRNIFAISSGLNLRFVMAAAQGDLCWERYWKETEEAKPHGRLTITGDHFRFILFSIGSGNGWKGEIPNLSVESCRAEAAADFAAYLEKCPSCPKEFALVRELAAYVDWSCVVPAGGFLKRPAVLMSKNWMASVWSWDHCLNAMALSYFDPEGAWDQFMLPFDNQEENGAIPDCINNTHAIRVVCKPPVHGWTLRRMMRNMTLTEEQLAEAYDKLSRWTNWWLDYRDMDGDGLCEYYDGGDSGWDNSTLFRDTLEVESPDLAAFLVVQMDVLSDLAGKLGKPEEGKEWKNGADRMLARMEQELFDEEGLPFARDAFSHRKIEAGSLMKYLPIILGERLPESIKDSLISGLKNSGCLTEYGFATESVSSPDFGRNGYWRGPIWSPVTLILTDGLYRAGEKEFAEAEAKKFCHLVEKSGFRENYDAISGEGLCDSAYSWSASIFLILAHEFIPQD